VRRQSQLHAATALIDTAKPSQTVVALARPSSAVAGTVAINATGKKLRNAYLIRSG
jgi:hypothetical protein